MQQYLKAIAGGRTLTGEEAEAAMHVLMQGKAGPECVAGFLVGLRARGESLEELVAFAKVMRAYAVSVDPGDPEAIDVCGTGGDGRSTFNISTAAALVCAGAGITVAKHGNRSVSSRCGSADVLEALGVRVELGKPGVEHCFEHAGIAFLYAPLFHPAMKHVMPVRRKLGVRSFFNILGPLCNPAGVRRQLTGSFDAATARTMASILGCLDAHHVLAVHAEDGMDEVSLSAPTVVFETVGSSMSDRGDEYRLTSPRSNGVAHIRPEDFGLARASAGELAGGDAGQNAAIIHAILGGQPGPARDVVVMNAACGLLVSGRYASLGACRRAAEESIDSGGASRALERLVHASNAAPAP